MTKAPTTDQLIVLAGLDKSPDEVIAERRKQHKRITNPSLIRRLWTEYILSRLRDHDEEIGMVFAIIKGVLSIGAIGFVANALMSGILQRIGAAVVLEFMLLLILFVGGSRENRMKKEVWKPGATEPTYVDSVPHLLLYIGRNMLLAPLDLLLLHKMGKRSESVFEAHKRVTAPFDAAEEIRKIYNDGLSRISDDLIGPNSDWSRSLADLEARRKDAAILDGRLYHRIERLKKDGNQGHVLTLQAARSDNEVMMLELEKAEHAMKSLIEQTRSAISKCYQMVDDIGGVYGDADLLLEVSAKIAGSESAIRHAKDLRDQAYGRIARHLSAIAGVVTSHRLQLESDNGSVDLTKYFDEVSVATSSLVKIGED